ncbi:MAG: hypothetical protein ACN6O8_19135 [Achromobacter sp.]|uniref:hypothetical protein n=1 Tax=Achromobacter sp. TaxID=134375 RepID=UPI003D05AFBC
MALSRSQTVVKATIVDHGRQRGVSPPAIQIAADIAYIESAFGASPRDADAGSSACGLFGYTEETWREHHHALGDKHAPCNQITAFYNDLAVYMSWYNSPATNRHIPDDMTLGEFVFIMHHGGRGGPLLCKDAALERYRAHITDDTRRLTATYPEPCPGALVLDAEAYSGYAVTGDSAGCIKVAADGEAYIDYILEPLLSDDERRSIVERDPDGAFHILDA